jgi:F0F1-type ATP synthase membrane subunit b/b'
MHIESLKARINEIDTKISSVRSEADLLHKDSLRKAAEIMAGAQAEANSTLANKIKSLIEESDKKIVDIKERFNHEFDDDLTGRADRVAEKVLDSLFGSADGEK